VGGAIVTLAKCKENFLELLADDENHVIALAGKWGTGKSHLWREVQAISPDEKVQAAVYVSLFGVSSIAELKLKIAQGVLPKLQSGGATESIKNGLAGLKKVLQGFHSGFSALDELALIAAPMMIKGRFIVIDDIERKHEKLSIDEILGFIDDCVQNHGCRILLILNSDQLADKKLWEQFNEKVIDRELRLDTSPSEAFEIAAQLTATPYAAQIKPAVEACRITNIRIIRKIIRVVNRLLAGRGQLPLELLSRIIPSTTLLSAIYYKGLDDGPDFDFVLSPASTLGGRLMRTAKKDVEETPEQKARERWLLLLDKLGILGTDEFELLVVDHLKSGLMEYSAVDQIFDRYLREARELTMRGKVEEFFRRYHWNPELTETALLAELRALLPDIGLVDMYTVTSLCNLAEQMADGGDVGRELVNRWLTAFRERHPAGTESDLDPDRNYFGRPLHPDIAAELRAIQARKQSSATLLEVCRKINDDQSWGARETELMKSVTPAAYEAAILTAQGPDLKLLMLQSMDFLKNRSTWDEQFGGATQSFLDACRSIVERDKGTRLGRLVRDLFRDAGIEDLLAPGVGSSAAPAASQSSAPA
jgi:hypothetical protein